MNTIRQCFCFFAAFYFSYVFCNIFIGKQHKLFYKFVGIFRTFKVTAKGFSMLIYIKMQFFRFKLYTAFLYSFGTKLFCQTVKHYKFIGKFAFIFLSFWCRFTSSVYHSIIFQQLLHLFVSISTITFYNSMCNMEMFNFGIIV